MARNRKPHPADLANASIVAAAVRFDLSLFLGTGCYATDTAATLEEARVKAAGLIATYPNGRRPLIYGVTADGRSGLVSNAETLSKEVPMKTYAKKFNAQRAAKAAGYRPDEIAIVKMKSGFAYRAKASAQAAQALIAQAETARKAPIDRKREPETIAPATLGKLVAIETAARRGQLPEPPDFSAETHRRFRAKLQTVINFAKAGDLPGLRAFAVNPISTSPEAIDRYRKLCIVALEAQAANRYSP
jgi:hypothetical protein